MTGDLRKFQEFGFSVRPAGDLRKNIDGIAQGRSMAALLMPSGSDMRAIPDPEIVQMSVPWSSDS
jgi:hypothetical protein